MSRHIWTAAALDMLRKLYPHRSAKECADMLGIKEKSVQYAAAKYSIRKSAEWIAERSRLAMQRPDHPAHLSRFQPGLIPHNKGKLHPAKGRSIETQFKPGNKPHSWNPIGHDRVTKEGYLQRKTADTGCTRRDYVSVHHLVWRMHGRIVPPKHALIFIDGNKRNFDINNLAVIHRADLMRKNSVHNHGPEIAKAYQLIGAINRQINRKAKEQRA